VSPTVAFPVVFRNQKLYFARDRPPLNQWMVQCLAYRQQSSNFRRLPLVKSFFILLRNISNNIVMGQDCLRLPDLLCGVDGVDEKEERLFWRVDEAREMS